VSKVFCAVLLLGTCALGQQREIGFLGGGGFLKGLPVQDTSLPVTAGFQAGPAVGFLIGHDLYSRWSGEIRYVFEHQNLKLTAADGTAVSFGGQAHVVQYDVVFHTRPRNEKIRPYVAMGGGIKLYRGTGTETAYRPLMDYAYLTRTQELKPMFAVGGGVKVRMSRRTTLRIDLRDQITRFPEKVIAPAPGTKLSGWLHDFLPAVGISWDF